jgi:transcriptional regulator with XRE-family HTH domain
MPRAKQTYRPTYREVVGGNVGRLRRQRDLTQEDLGDRVGSYLGGHAWPKQIVSAIERGKRALDADELLATAFVLEAKVEQVLAPWWEDMSMPDEAEVELPGGEHVLAHEIRGAVAPGEGAAALAAMENALKEVRRSVGAGSHTVTVRRSNKGGGKR